MRRENSGPIGDLYIQLQKERRECDEKRKKGGEMYHEAI